MRPAWTKIILALAGLWLVVGGSLWWLNARKPTAEQIVEYVEGIRWMEERGGTESDHRARGRAGESARAGGASPGAAAVVRWRIFGNNYSAAEKGHYFELVVPSGLQVAIDDFNKMEPDGGRKEIEKAVKRLREDSEGRYAGGLRSGAGQEVRG